MDLIFLVPGTATGPTLVLDEPLSFWGGVDPVTGEIVDRSHPQSGMVITNRILVMPGGRGSSSASSVLAECIRAGTAPAGIILKEPDPLLTLGALVAAELYPERLCPIAIAVDYHEASTARTIVMDGS